MDCENCQWKKIPTIESDRLTEVKRLLLKSTDYIDQTPGRSGITGLQHALRTAGLAREKGWHQDSAFVGLVHDLARPLNDVHHGEIMAEIVNDRVSDEAYWVLRTHGEFQSAIVHDDPSYTVKYEHEPWYHWAKQLAAFEVRSFQNDYDGPTMSYSDAHVLLADYLA